MAEFRKTIVVLMVTCIVLFGLIVTSIILINKMFEKKPETVKISSRIVVEEITKQYFVVTKTVYLDQTSQIVVDQGSSWSNFWWGQTIEARAPMKVDVGVDLKELKEEDITVDNENMVIKIRIPEASILSTSLAGEIEVETSKGVLRKIFNNNTNDDYNQALNTLTNDANNSVKEDTELFNEARNDSIKLLSIIVKDLGYTIEIVGNDQGVD
jgi:hypothetical protein